MNVQNISWITSLLAINGQHSQSADLVADKVEKLFHDAHTALSPIIGNRGMESLRSANIQAMAELYPWLRCTTNDSASLAMSQSIRSLIAAQQLPIAEAAGIAIVQNFYLKLSDLIGVTLTEKLLRSVWEVSLTNVHRELE